MKKIFVFSMVVGGYLFAAEFSHDTKLGDEALNALGNAFEVYTNPKGRKFLFAEGSLSGIVDRVKIISKKPSEKWQTTLTRMIYWLRSQDAYSAPDEVSVTTTKKTEKNMRLALDGSALGWSHDEKEKLKEKAINEDLLPKTKQAISKKSHMRLYTGSDDNSFGTCSWAAIVDKKEMEILVLTSCYSE